MGPSASIGIDMKNKTSLILLAGKKVNIPNTNRNFTVVHLQDKEVFEKLNHKNSDGKYSYTL